MYAVDAFSFKYDLPVTLDKLTDKKDKAEKAKENFIVKIRTLYKKCNSGAEENDLRIIVTNRSRLSLLHL